MENLVEKMKECGCDRYECANGLIVTVTSKSKCRVQKKKPSPESNGHAGEDGDA